jgi:hypothetical protein
VWDARQSQALDVSIPEPLADALQHAGFALRRPRGDGEASCEGDLVLAAQRALGEKRIHKSVWGVGLVPPDTQPALESLFALFGPVVADGVEPLGTCKGFVVSASRWRCSRRHKEGSAAACRCTFSVVYYSMVIVGNGVRVPLPASKTSRRRCTRIRESQAPLRQFLLDHAPASPVDVRLDRYFPVVVVAVSGQHNASCSGARRLSNPDLLAVLREASSGFAAYGAFSALELARPRLDEQAQRSDVVVRATFNKWWPPECCPQLADALDVALAGLTGRDIRVLRPKDETACREVVRRSTQLGPRALMYKFVYGSLNAWWDLGLDEIGDADAFIDTVGDSASPYAVYLDELARGPYPDIALFVATPEMTRAAALYGASVFMDSTHDVGFDLDGKTMLLMRTLMVKAAGDVTLPIAMCFHRGQAGAVDIHFLQLCSLAFGRRIEEWSAPAYVTVDLSATEITGVRTVWPKTQIKLCMFHALQSFDRFILRSPPAKPRRPDDDSDGDDADPRACADDVADECGAEVELCDAGDAAAVFGADGADDETAAVTVERDAVAACDGEGCVQGGAATAAVPPVDDCSDLPREGVYGSAPAIALNVRPENRDTARNEFRAVMFAPTTESCDELWAAMLDKWRRLEPKLYDYLLLQWPNRRRECWAQAYSMIAKGGRTTNMCESFHAAVKKTRRTSKLPRRLDAWVTRAFAPLGIVMLKWGAYVEAQRVAGDRVLRRVDLACKTYDPDCAELLHEISGYSVAGRRLTAEAMDVIAAALGPERQAPLRTLKLTKIAGPRSSYRLGVYTICVRGFKGMRNVNGWPVLCNCAAHLTSGLPCKHVFAVLLRTRLRFADLEARVLRVLFCGRHVVDDAVVVPPRSRRPLIYGDPLDGDGRLDDDAAFPPGGAKRGRSCSLDRDTGTGVGINEPPNKCQKSELDATIDEFRSTVMGSLLLIRTGQAADDDKRRLIGALKSAETTILDEVARFNESSTKRGSATRAQAQARGAAHPVPGTVQTFAGARPRLAKTPATVSSTTARGARVGQ